MVFRKPSTSCWIMPIWVLGFKFDIRNRLVLLLVSEALFWTSTKHSESGILTYVTFDFNWLLGAWLQMGNVSLVDHRWWPTENHCQDWPFLTSQDSWIFLCKEKLHLILSLQKIKIPIKLTWHRIRNLSFWITVDLIGHKYSPKRISKTMKPAECHTWLQLTLASLLGGLTAGLRSALPLICLYDEPRDFRA